MDKYFRRTWTKINLDALKHNYETIREYVSPQSEIMAVVKADAYGHGVENVVKEFTNCGCNYFAVSNLEEAMQVRSANDNCAILILGYTPPEYAGALALNNISQSVFNEEYASRLSKAAVDSGLQVNIHVKVDTGMGRLGFLFSDSIEHASSIETVANVCKLPGLFPEGIFTHFSSADEKGDGEVFTRIQYDLFCTFIRELEFEGVKFALRHCCNSAATILYPEMHMDAVRPGIILYGLTPSPNLKGILNLKPALAMETVVSMVKEVTLDSPVSYGRKYYTGNKTVKVATIPVGYADGYCRCTSNDVQVKIGNEFAPVIGAVCMDQCMVDVTNIENIKEGMTVTIIDSDISSPLSVDALALKSGKINYEIICGINKRVSRVYTREGKITAIVDYMKN